MQAARGLPRALAHNGPEVVNGPSHFRGSLDVNDVCCVRIYIPESAES
jgi:hypothetical protein